MTQSLTPNTARSIYLSSTVEICSREPIEKRKELLADLLSGSRHSLVFNECFQGDGETVFREACKLGCEGIVSKRLGSHYRSGRSPHWIKVKNPNAPAVKREAEEDWGR